ncbi:MAG: IS1595 family transposase [Proteobacteria bacterium]|nr:IS1595 family transposase [Pseudomonadota bacterium]
MIAINPWRGYNRVINNDDVGKMPQHFLKCSRARSLSVKEVMRMTEEDAFDLFRKLRWPDSDGKPICPHCGHERSYLIRTRNIYKCAACRQNFSVTSGTIFHSAKLELRDYLAVIALFVNAVKGISALQISRDVGISYKAAFVLLHKLREAIEDGRNMLVLNGEVEIDGAYYGGHVRPGNVGRDGKRPSNKRRKKCVLTLVQRGGPTIPMVVPSESTKSVLEAARRHISPGSVVHADEHAAYDALHARYEVFRINHRWSYSDGIACTNQAESFHARMRRAEIGQYHRISARFLQRYAFEAAYRSDRRAVDNGSIFAELTEMALNHPVSREWKGYWQKRAA